MPRRDLCERGLRRPHSALSARPDDVERDDDPGAGWRLSSPTIPTRPADGPHPAAPSRLRAVAGSVSDSVASGLSGFVDGVSDLVDGVSDLVHDVAREIAADLAAFGPQPALAGIDGPADRDRDWARDWDRDDARDGREDALVAWAVDSLAGHARTGRASRSGGRVGGSPRPIPTDSPEQEIDEAHIESWRLVARAQEGDGDAFGLLYDRYVDLVYRFIYYRVDDRTLAEDFTSETFLRALRRITTISYQGRDIGAWFVTIARNIVLDHVKSARHRLETTTAEVLDSEDDATTESAVLEALTNERLMAAVAQLGDEQRECVLLRFIQGFSVSETAAVMGKNDGAIKALQHRAVRKLAELVGDELR